MSNVVIAQRAIEQIAEVIDKTRLDYGERKAREYDELVESALNTLAEDPRTGTHHPEIHPDAWTYHIGKQGEGRTRNGQPVYSSNPQVKVLFRARLFGCAQNCAMVDGFK